MYVIVGLGNPEKEYKGTRHNIGFETINKLAYDNKIEINKNKHKAHIGEGFINGKKVMLVKPQTYMNLSGQSVKEIISYYKLTHENVVIIYDDTSIDLGNIKIKTKGSAGGHNGIKSIIAELGTDEFIRIKVGIDKKPEGIILSNYVLSGFKKHDFDKMIMGVTKAGEAVENYLDIGIEKTMTKFNTK